MEFDKFNKDENALVLATSGESWGFVFLSNEAVAGLINGDVKFVKKDNEIVLTKEELIAEFKIGLKKGYFTKEDLLD